MTTPLRLSDFSVLTFDCYGTLIDWERGILNELVPWAARHGIAADDDRLLEAFAAAEARAESESPTMRYPQILEVVLERLADAAGVRLAAGEAAAFGASVGRWPAFDDSPAALAYLQRHYKLVVLSNVDHGSFAKSQERLRVVFDRAITAQDIGSYKPNPRNFTFAIAEIHREFGVDSSQILHVAQSIFHDIIPAKTLGLHTVWVNRRKGRAGWGATPAPALTGAAASADLEVASLQELADLHATQSARASRLAVRP